jgi:hypothetical protein
MFPVMRSILDLDLSLTRAPYRTIVTAFPALRRLCAPLCPINDSFTPLSQLGSLHDLTDLDVSCTPHLSAATLERFVQQFWHSNKARGMKMASDVICTPTFLQTCVDRRVTLVLHVCGTCSNETSTNATHRPPPLRAAVCAVFLELAALLKHPLGIVIFVACLMLALAELLQDPLAALLQHPLGIVIFVTCLMLAMLTILRT